MRNQLFIILAILTIVSKRISAYPSQERLMPEFAPTEETRNESDSVDRPSAKVRTDEKDVKMLNENGDPVPGDLIHEVHEVTSIHEDSMASASETHADDYDDQDDSDMYMEPDGAGTSHEVSTHGSSSQRTETVTSSSVSVSQKNPSGEEIRLGATISQPILQQEDEIIQTPIARQVGDKSLESDSQNFFPSFAELFANHRLSYNEQQQQQRYRPNRFLGYFQRDRNTHQTTAATVKDAQHPLLGSGNFGVIRGGTYYPEDKENEEYHVDESLYNPYYSTNAPRARTNYYRNPKPQPIRSDDFFANFRDFADITAPPKSSFSHLSVVYANRNDTRSHFNEPRNIIETLKMLEEQEDFIDGVNGATTTTEAPMKKLSQGKRKLITIKKYHDEKARKSRLIVEPLLALS